MMIIFGTAKLMGLLRPSPHEDAASGVHTKSHRQVGRMRHQSSVFQGCVHQDGPAISKSEDLQLLSHGLGGRNYAVVFIMHPISPQLAAQCRGTEY